MKRRNVVPSLVLMSFILVILSCSKEESTQSLDLRIDKIHHYYESDTFIEFYGWEDDKYLNRIVIEEESKILFTYSGERLRTIKTYYNSFNSGLQPERIDSLFYEDELLSHRRQEIFYQESLNLSSSVYNYFYEYDSQDRIIKIMERYGTLDTGPYEQYLWENDNIISKEYRDANSDLILVYFYKHDSNPNFNLNNPYRFNSPEQMSKNNIKSFTWDNYSIFVHYPTNPCVSNIEYGDHGWPTNINHCFQSLDIEYHE